MTGSNNIRPAPLLCMGAPRTGTASLAAALRILGHSRVHHGLDLDASSSTWTILDRAADASFPCLPTYTGRPFERVDWDELTDSWDAVTDIFALFGPSLLAAYPDAKVILVERDVDAWYCSWVAVNRPWYGLVGHAIVRTLEPLTGNIAGAVSYKYIRGWIGSSRRQDIFLKAKDAYARHYREVRSTVPSSQLLDFQLSDGWEPLCSFLDKPIPDVPFPHVNDAAAYKAATDRMRREGAKMALRKVLHIRPKEHYGLVENNGKPGYSANSDSGLGGL